MFTLITIFGVSFLFCFFLTPLARGLATRYRLVDRPDGERKLQARPTPTAGGLVVLLSGCASIVVLLVVPSPLCDFVLGPGRGPWLVFSWPLPVPCSAF